VQAVPYLVAQHACAGMNNIATAPNPSLKPSPNSVPRQPASAGPSHHCALAVRHVTLSVPA